MNLKERWYNLFEGTKYSILSKEYSFIEKQYSENDRTYHNIEHLKQSFKVLDTFCTEGTYNFDRGCFVVSDKEEYTHQKSLSKLDISVIEIVIFYHDIIYNPQDRILSSEYKSSIQAYTFLNMIETVPYFYHAINLILATQEGYIPKTDIEKLMIDIDYSILGAENSIFENYEDAIRLEYDFLPDQWFDYYRKKWIENLLANGIFHTDFFINKFSKQALYNLQNSRYLS